MQTNLSLPCLRSSTNYHRMLQIRHKQYNSCHLHCNSKFSTTHLQLLSYVPSKPIYETNNDRLHQKSTQLKSRSSQLEHLYRKVVSLCTGVAEDKVEDQLGALLAAVESEKGALGREEAGRVREFLIKVEGVGGGSEVVAAV